MAACGMGLCRQCTFFNKRYGFIGARYGFQSKCTFQRLTPVDPPGKSSQWGFLLSPQPAQSAISGMTWA